LFTIYAQVCSADNTDATDDPDTLQFLHQALLWTI
jgi:hypothetical protein